MFSSEDDEQDDLGMFDQLKCIKPFTIEQLYSLDPDVSCPPKCSIAMEAERDDKDAYTSFQVNNEIYYSLVEHEKLRNKLIDLKHDIKKLYKKTHANIDKAWTFREESTRKIAMCQQGKIAETTFKYKQAQLDKKHLETFAQGFNELSEKITKDYIYYSFESQTKRNKIATHLSIAYQTPDIDVRKAKLRAAIVTLNEFVRYLSDTKSDFTLQCRKWLRALIRRFLEDGSTDSYRFVISQLARGRVGTADWSADLVECKPYEQVTGFDSVPQYITHCSALLAELFYSLQMQIKQVTNASTLQSRDNNVDQNEAETTSQVKGNDQDWSLVDPRFSCVEELNISSNFENLLSESDVIKFCLRMPVAQIFRAYVKKCLGPSDEFRLEVNKNYECIMLKLLTIGTNIIKTYQIGLETFNSIQYGSLIEYLSSQIRRTVMILSDQWTEFKRRLKGVDDALVMRLQVEYDNFMLRSILVILELRESGIWRHLSRIEPEAEARNEDRNVHGWATDSLRPAFEKILQVTGISNAQQDSQLITTPDHVTELQPSNKDAKAHQSSSTSLTYEFCVEWFREVSEPMLWHILWQFYHNGFMNSCDYHSDSYWLKKFQEKSVVYLFVNKIRDSPVGECSYLINSITSMLLSRTNHESKLVNFIASEIFHLTFKHQSVKEKVNKRGLKSLIRCAEKFPSLISLYISLMVDESELDPRATDLMRGCSLSGWLFDEDELAILESWLIEHSLESPRNKVARLVISKVLLNSPTTRCSSDLGAETESQEGKLFQMSARKNKPKRPMTRNHCFVDLKTRRKLVLMLYKASIKHYPEEGEFGPQSLGVSVEVAFGSGIYCEQAGVPQNNLAELAIDTSYQQFYIWTWRLLFIMRLHILNQPETDWNDVQSRSGTSRSIKNTVIMNDPFHPVPSIEDTECSQLRDGLKEQNPVASFIYLILTDATWQVNTMESCVTHLNILANSGHITPSLMAMKYLTICHLNDLLDVLANDKKCSDYFTTIILSNFDATRLASLIATKLDRLKPYRQLQLSHFYIRVLLEINKIIAKRMASSWFSNNEISFEKIACLLDFLVRFNFATQRVEIVRKFYDCAYVVQDGNQANRTNGWLLSFVTSNSIEKDLSTNLHLLSQKFKKYTWLQWVNTECDALRLEKIWEDIVIYLSGNEDATLDAAIRKVCPNVNATSLRGTLPIFSWIRQIFEIMESDLNHPLCPLIWYNFFLNYFANSLNGVSVGFKLISQETVTRLLTRLDSLYNYHTYKQRNWLSTSVVQQNSLTSLYKAYKLWLQDPSLRDAYIDIDRLREDYLVPLLKAVMESSQSDVCLPFIDIQSVETQNRNLMQVWIASTRLTVAEDGDYLDGSILCYDNNETGGDMSRDDSMNVADDMMANDAVSLIVRSYKSSPNNASNGKALDNNQLFDNELAKPLAEDSFGERKYQSTDELMDEVKRNFQYVFEESNVFALNISELERTKCEILELVQQLYINKSREFIRVVPCAEGNECPGPARIKLEASEAQLDERKSQCIQDRRRQCQELLAELLLMPKNRVVQSTVIIEEDIKRLISDPDRSGLVIETLLTWLSEPSRYNQLNGSYHAANNLLKATLEILSTTDRADIYNRTLVEVCMAHPDSVQVLSPYLSPSTCAPERFLELYKVICSKLPALGSMATFVLVSKFDIHSHLDAKNGKGKQAHHELIKTTCSALKDVSRNQDDDNCELILDLFRRHLQIELTSPSRQQPDEFLLALKEFLPAMSDHALAPSLWLDYLSIMGLEVNARKADKQRGDQCPAQPLDESNLTIASVAEDVARLAETQVIFDYDATNKFMQIISEYMRQIHDSSSATLLELYLDYLEQFGMVLLSATFMWLKPMGELYPDNHELIWKQFKDLWNDWVFLTKNCQNVSKSSYSLIASYFVVSLRYMIHKMPRNTCYILQFVLFELTNYVVQTREVIHLELTILQRSLKSLPWSYLVATPADIGNLAALSEQDNYNVSDLVSHILMEMSTRESLYGIQQNEPACLAHVVERLATIIVLQSNHLKGYKLHGRFFKSIPIDDLPRLASLVLAHTEISNPEHSHRNKLLVELMRYACMDSSSTATTNTTSPTSRGHGFDAHNPFTSTPTPLEKLERAVIYARFVSNYLTDLIKRLPVVADQHKHYLNLVINNSLADLDQMLCAPEIQLDQKTRLYNSLLECCSCETLEFASRHMLAMSVVESHLLRTKPRLALELTQALGQFVKDSRVLVLMVESLVDLYRQTHDGQHETLWSNFELRSVTKEVYLNTCVEEKATLALMVFFESLFGAEQSDLTTNQIWSDFFAWLAKLTQTLCSLKSSDHLDGPKLTSAWVKVLAMFETHLAQYLPVESQTSPGAKSDSNGSGDKSTNESETSAEQSSATGGAAAAAAGKDAEVDQKCLLDFIKQLIAFYDSVNTSGLWSYLKSSVKSETSCKASVIALAIACFLADRAHIQLANYKPPASQPDLPARIVSLRDELARLLKTSLGKLEAARKSKSLQDSAQFIETLIESVQQHEKVQYNEGVQLIKTYARAQ